MYLRKLYSFITWMHNDLKLYFLQNRKLLYCLRQKIKKLTSVWPLKQSSWIWCTWNGLLCTHLHRSLFPLPRQPMNSATLSSATRHFFMHCFYCNCLVTVSLFVTCLQRPLWFLLIASAGIMTLYLSAQTPNVLHSAVHHCALHHSPYGWGAIVLSAGLLSKFYLSYLL